MTRAAARRATRHTEPASGRDKPRRGRGRRRAGKNRRQAGIGLRSGCGRARRGRGGQKPAARRTRSTQGDAARRHALAHFQYPPFPRSAGKNWRRTEPAARWVRPHGERGRAGAGRRGGHGTRWLPANIRLSRGAQAKTGGGQNPRRAGIGCTGNAGGRRATRRARHALAHFQYPPFPRGAGKNRRAQGDAAHRTGVRQG